MSQSFQAILGGPGLKGKPMPLISNNGLYDFIHSTVVSHPELNDPFYVLDVGTVVSLMNKWARSLPAVKPYYAVKCNPDPAFLGVMAALGTSFDCASRTEIESVLALGVSPDRIIYANPCKAASHIKYAASVGVNLTTFDSVYEVEKIQKQHPNSDLLIRIRAPDEAGALYALGQKYGALPEEVEPLIRAAEAAHLTVSGVSFHIGSGATRSTPYRAAIAEAKSVFDTAARLGLPRMHVLNIGGGFTDSPLFEEAAKVVKSAIKMYFPNQPGLTVMAEPGRFLAESAFTLAAKIIGKRVRGEVREYWMNDGVFGSLNCVLYDHPILTVRPLASKSNPANPTCEEMETYTSTVFGPTCDAYDTILRGHGLPELQIDDWLVFPNMGAYAAATASNFNGFNASAIPIHLAFSSLTDESLVE